MQRWGRLRTEAHTGADGSLRQQHRTPPARHFLSQAAETHQAGIGSVEHVTGHDLTVDHTYRHGCVGHLWVRGGVKLYLLLVSFAQCAQTER